MKRTNKYQLAYWEQGDLLTASPETQRWETLDVQLFALFSIIGNGIVEGWQLLRSSGLTIVVSPGKAHVNFVAVKTDSITSVSLNPNIKNYIYATLNDSSYWDQSVSLFSSTSTFDDDTDQYLYLGYVQTNATSVTSIVSATDNRLGFVNLIQDAVASHRHVGGENNPPPVNLASEVQGIINQSNLPYLDASIIQTGILDDDRFPQLDHITKLINQGTLTHAQLDSFVNALSISSSTLMGETSTINLLQLILALKHIYPNVDDYLVNEIAYIPGISPDSYVDQVNTTATVDYRPWSQGGQHTISGSAAPGQEFYTKTWNTKEEFESGTSSGVYIDRDFVSLDASNDSLVIDSFDVIDDWSTVFQGDVLGSIGISLDSSTYVDPLTSGKLVIGDRRIQVVLHFKKDMDAQDWSDYNYLILYIRTDSVTHGDLYFYLSDADYGVQNSYTKILDRNAPTINVDTLRNGWQEVMIDISSYQREKIDEMGFYVSSNDGWDPSLGFTLNVDKITLYNGNKFNENGYVRLIFGGDYLYNFSKVRWDASIPADALSTGVALKYRTRVGNSLADLAQSTWSSYSSTSGTDISLPAESLYRYIEIEMYFIASTNLLRSPFLYKLYLDFYVTSAEGSIVFDTQDSWESGTLFNADTTSPGSLLIASTDEVDDIFYGTQSNVVQLKSNLSELYRITGTMLPRNTYQVLNDYPPSLSLVTGVAKGDQGNIWITDTDNDRVVELDKSGYLIRGFYGSFLKAPVEVYGDEESGPGSNVMPSTTTTTTTLTTATTLSVLHSLYNPADGILYIVFDRNLEKVHVSNTKFDVDRLYVKVGPHRFNLSDSTAGLVGIDPTKYNNWYGLVSSGTTGDYDKFINQFNFESHILKLTLNGADRVAFNHMVNSLPPSVIVVDPKENERVSSSVSCRFAVSNFKLGTQGESNRIRVTIDGSTVRDIYGLTTTFTGLSVGDHTIKVELVNANGTVNTNIEAVAEGTFYVSRHSVNDPYITIESPRINQIYSSSPVAIDFEVGNFPILGYGQHLRYKLDSEAPVDHYTTSNITIEDVSAGAHSIRLYLVDEDGTDLGYAHGTATVNFIVGTNSNALAKLHIQDGAIYDTNGSITTSESVTNVDVANVVFTNTYAPFDIQVIPAETSNVNIDGLPTVLVSKLRSKSWTNGLSGSSNVNQFIQYIQAEAAAEGSSNVSSSVISSLIYGTNYLDGHSVVQMDMDGDVIMSNNAAPFASSKSSVKDVLGSAEKVGSNEILIADPSNKRAIIVYVDLDTQVPQIEWEYESDRYISDFHLINKDDVVVSIRDDAVVNSTAYIRKGTTVIWENNSSSPITIYSGSVTISSFAQDPDLNNYGHDFKSAVLQVGERYAFKFVEYGDFNWFVYPGLLTGTVSVLHNRVSSQDEFLVLENDGLEAPFASRVIKMDSWGNVIWTFGEAYLVKPRDARPLLNDDVLIST